MDLGLKNKVVLVTAASRGLGKAAALQFAREGAKLAVCSRTEQIHAAADDIARETGAEVLGIPTDLTQPQAIRHLAEAALGRFGQVDIVILNAGGPAPGGFLSLQAEDWEQAFQ